MTPPRWPFLVEIDALSQLKLFYATEHRTTVPLGMRIVGRNVSRDTYFIAPWGLHLLYRRLLRRYDRAQQVLQQLRTGNDPTTTPASSGSVTIYPAGSPAWTTTTHTGTTWPHLVSTPKTP